MDSASSPCNSRLQVCYYITGHGLGHATRSLELIQHLLASDEFDVHVVTNVKADFFYSGLRDCGLSEHALSADRFTHTQRMIDTGAVQSDVFTVDPLATLRLYEERIHRNRQSLLQDEVVWLKERRVQLVLVDASPLGCRAGAEAGAKVVLLSNFSWDFCFDSMLQLLRGNGDEQRDEAAFDELQTVVQQCADDSASCDLYLQLPGETPLPKSSLRNTMKLKQGPLIVRPMRQTAAAPRSDEADARIRTSYYRSSDVSQYDAFVASMRKEFDIPSGKKVLLLGFGGHATSWKLRDEALPEGWVCLTLGERIVNNT